jgi:uncharacterized protein YecE (DUF72 family)
MGTDADPPPKPRQQGLFGPLAGERLPPTVPPAAVDDAIAALARGVPAAVRLGTSSWNFPGWRGLVYAPRAKPEHLSQHGLAAYARHPLLRAVGIDRTFYAPVDRAEFAGYRDQVPADFRFLVKGLGELLTPRLRSGAPNELWLDAARFAAQCVEPTVVGFGERLEVLLLQFPPQGAAVTALRRVPAHVPHETAAVDTLRGRIARRGAHDRRLRHRAARRRRRARVRRTPALAVPRRAARGHRTGRGAGR